MNQIAEHINAIRNAETEIRNHCMCARYEVTETHYRVIYPEGYFPNGVQVSRALGKMKALYRLLAKMEQHWKESQL